MLRAAGRSDALSSLTEDIMTSPEKYMDDFREQLRESPMLADMAGEEQRAIMIRQICDLFP